MPSLVLNIRRKKDVIEAGKIFPDLNEDNTIAGESQCDRVALVEGGMVSGKAIVVFDVVLPDGKHTQVQLSQGIFESVAAGLQGALKNWENNPQ